MTEVFAIIGNTVALVAAPSSSRVPLTDPRLGSDSRTAMLFNAGENDAFVAFGPGSVAAVIPVAGSPANGTPLPAGAYMPFRLTAFDTHLAAITASGATTIYVTAGQGF